VARIFLVALLAAVVAGCCGGSSHRPLYLLSPQIEIRVNPRICPYPSPGSDIARDQCPELR
jgi:hypothetical protein